MELNEQRRRLLLEFLGLVQYGSRDRGRAIAFPAAYTYAFALGIPYIEYEGRSTIACDSSCLDDSLRAPSVRAYAYALGLYFVFADQSYDEGSEFDREVDLVAAEQVPPHIQKHLNEIAEE